MRRVDQRELEQAVIEAAREWRAALPSINVAIASKLAMAVDALNESDRDWAEREIAQAPSAEADNTLIWVLRTWADVRSGDDIRMPGTSNEAYVQSAVHLQWHVDPRGSEYQPQPLEWSGVRVVLHHNTKGARVSQSEWTMDPAKPIEIQLSQGELDSMRLLANTLLQQSEDEMWAGRQGLVTE